MKFTCEKQILSNALTIVSRAIPVKTTMSILQCVLVEANAEGIRFTANDMELGIETVVEGQVEEPGIVAIEEKIFHEIVRKLPEGEIRLTVDPSLKVTIQSGRSKFNLIGRSTEEFTYLPTVERIDSIRMTQLSLKNVISQTIFSTKNDETNKMMGGELIQIDQDTFKMVSLDGHRISIRRLHLASSYAPRKVVVPAKTLDDISRILPDSAENQVSLTFTGKHMVFDFDRTTVISRLLEGEFYAIDQMLSSDFETKMTINRHEFLDCLDRTTLLVKENDKKPVILNITDEQMSLKIRSTIGSFDEEIEVEKQGKDLMIGFNPRFLLDAMRAIEDETVDFYFVNPKAPCFIKDTEDKYIYLILPVNFTVVD
ncbi:MAG: DNA polymerase III subunit beta [Butyrivibrio sp.]|nr:DNA polymerase III subunit beta [Butyrivibrio sp.]